MEPAMHRFLLNVLSCVCLAFPAAPLLAQGGTSKTFPEPHPNPVTTVRVIGFAGGFNLPIWVAQRQGFFANEKLDVKLDFTPGSTWQITHLLAGNYDIAMTAYDNVIAYREGQNEAFIPPDVKVDLVSVLHSDNAFLSISAQPDVRRFSDLKGRTVTVDAMTTGFAFVLRETLQRQGVAESDVRFERAGGVSSRFRAMTTNPSHAATMQMTPFELLGEARGFNTLARVPDVVGPYMGMTAAVRQSWAERNRGVVVGYVRAYQRAIDWMFDPAHRAEVEAMLVANVQGMTPSLAAQAYELYVGKQAGFRRSVAFDAAAAKTVADLRSKYGQPARRLADPAAYFDASYLAEAGVK
jgi:ABC-type nitrate/sulfonate/bicarbonate transport system substrate-binding protein